MHTYVDSDFPLSCGVTHKSITVYSERLLFSFSLWYLWSFSEVVSRLSTPWNDLCQQIDWHTPNFSQLRETSHFLQRALRIKCALAISSAHYFWVSVVVELAIEVTVSDLAQMVFHGVHQWTGMFSELEVLFLLMCFSVVPRTHSIHQFTVLEMTASEEQK